MSDWIGLCGELLVLFGSLLVVISGIGLLRFPDVYTRIHAAGVGSTSGVLFVLLGLMLHNGLDNANYKLLLLMFFLIFVGPMASHALGHAALRAGVEPLTTDGSSGKETH